MQAKCPFSFTLKIVFFPSFPTDVSKKANYKNCNRASSLNISESSEDGNQTLS